jgi:hypothetical protein
VFIRIDAAEGLARLYFRGPFGHRYLLRRIALPNGLDAVGKELIGQVAESAVLALLRSSTGISREQANGELSREFAAKEPPAASRPSVPRHADEFDPPRTWFALRYIAAYFGPDFGLAHGPGAEFGIRGRQALPIGARLSLERFFGQALHAEPVAVEVQTYSLRLQLDIGVPMGKGQSIVAALGPGLDVTHIAPGTPHAVDVVPSRARYVVRMVVRPELRYEITYRSLLLAIGGFGDVALSDTHYDLMDRGTRKSLGAPWKLRLGASLTGGVRW